MNDIVVAAGAFFLIHSLATNKKNKKKKARKMWMRRLFLRREKMTIRRNIKGGHLNNFAKMTAEDFERLIILVGPRIAKKDTILRKAIPVQVRLAITLHYLATGDSYTNLQYLFKVSKQCISTIIMESCNALIQELQEQIKVPTTSEEWLRISNEFEQNWQFPHCVGALDAKHIITQGPFHNDTEFNHKPNYNIVLFALVDADYNFTFVDIGYKDSGISDDDVFKNTSLYKKLETNDLNLPQDSMLHSLNKMMPYVFVANEAFPLTNHVMKPFSGLHDKGTMERVFNFRFSRAKRIVDNAFGVISTVFRVLRKPMLLEAEKAKIVVITVACLHNFLRKSHSSRNVYTPHGTFDQEDEHGNLIPGSWSLENDSETSFFPIGNMPCEATNAAREIRNNFAHYMLNNKT